jgi:hypothetical protein
MDVRFVLPDIELLDEIECEALAMPFYEDERPLRGVLGMLDWRLCGFVSRMIIRGRICGCLGEAVLLPGRPHLNVDKLFLFGQGLEEAWTEERARQTTERMLSALGLAAARTSVLALPGRETEGIAPARAMEIFLQVSKEHPEHDEVIVVESEWGQKAMTSVLERQRRRDRALDG